MFWIKIVKFSYPMVLLLYCKLPGCHERKLLRPHPKIIFLNLIETIEKYFSDVFKLIIEKCLFVSSFCLKFVKRQNDCYLFETTRGRGFWYDNWELSNLTKWLPPNSYHLPKVQQPPSSRPSFNFIINSTSEKDHQSTYANNNFGVPRVVVSHRFDHRCTQGGGGHLMYPL